MVAKLFLFLCLLFSLKALAVTQTVEMIQVTPEISLETTIYKPDGPGPFPLLVMNHGKNLVSPRKHSRSTFNRFANEFLKRGYAVVFPMREGFSKSSGNMELSCDQAENGLIQARDIRLTLDYFTKLSWVDKDRIIIAGQSFGGLATIAFGAQHYPGVRGTINFAGGIKFFYGCDLWEDRLVEAATIYGLFSKTPTLWFYGRTDSFFGPALAKRMFEAYSQAGAPITFIKDPSCVYKSDSHGMIGWSDGVPCYWPDTEKFLKSIGMPTTDLQAHEDFPDPNK